MLALRGQAPFDGSQFKKMSVTNRIDFEKNQRLCKNCFSKTHAIKDCICKWKCRANLCSKKHHTLLCQDDTQQQANINNTFSQHNQKVDSITFLQVIPLKISNGSKTLDVNALLDSGSDATLITSKLAHQLQLKGEMKQLNISNAISKSVAVKSKLVTFSISLRHHPEHLQVHNAWVVDTLNLPPPKISKREIQSQMASPQQNAT